MAYKRISAMELYEIISRWHGGYNISQISKARGPDRKTVRHYINVAKQAGLRRDHPLPEMKELLKQLQALLPQKEYEQPARSVFLPYKDEIIRLTKDKREPIKPKTAYEVICERHVITASYTSFKRFIREHVPELDQKPSTTCRFETAPGDEVQIDYAKMGRLYNPLSCHNHDVFVFIATLSFSRLKFVELVYKQDQRSFVGSHLRMFEFFGGVPKRLVIDNLKAGVLKADLYTPEFNRAYQEMAEHYGCFIDPARPYRPKDEGIAIGMLPNRPNEKGIPGPGLLAHIAISKFVDHLPLYRQIQQFKSRNSGRCRIAKIVILNVAKNLWFCCFYRS